MSAYTVQVRKSDDIVDVLWRGRRPVNWVCDGAFPIGSVVIKGKGGQGKPFADKDTVVFAGHAEVYNVVGVNLETKQIIINPALTTAVADDEAMTFTSPIPVAQPSDPHRIYEITQAQYAEINSKGLNYPEDGPSRWSYPFGGALTELSDSRPFVKFTPTLLEVTENDPIGSLQVEVVTAAGARRTNVSGEYKVRVGGKRVAKVTITDGVGTLNVQTDDPYEITLKGTVDYQAFEPCTVICYADGIGPPAR